MRYPNGRGVFDVDFGVGKGQVVGFLGPNGAGKTTTIRCLLGFMRGQTGQCTIDGRDCFTNAPEIMKGVGFIAGEPAFPDGMDCLEYLNFLIQVRAAENKQDKGFTERTKKRMNDLIEYFELNPKGKIKKFSKGMKQKTAIVATFMHDPDVYILDEPTSGLDPLMQNRFVGLLLNEKKRGKTILISSHMFEEVERTADHVVIIKDGRIVVSDSIKNLKKAQRKVFIVTTPDAKKIKTGGESKILSDTELEISVPFDGIDKFLKELAKHTITNIGVKEASLEDVFMTHYKGGTK